MDGWILLVILFKSQAMSPYDHILAKSAANGGTSLKDHILSVAKYSEMAASYFGLDTGIAKMGALIHDIGKASPLFQRKLEKGYYPSPHEMNFRHEIASIFFLPLLDKEKWPPIIDMVIAHHKSTTKDARELGVLDLDYNYGDDVFHFHATEFDYWSKNAIGLLNELGIEGTNITTSEAFDAYTFVINYCKTKEKGWSKWKGLLIGADHIASAIGSAHDKVPKLFSSPKLDFYNRKNNLYPLSLISSDLEKQHTFVKAPTGAGKTDFLLKRCNGRVFYTLPFQASINAMYDRIKNDLKNVEDIRLLHSTSRLVVEGNKIEERVIQDKIGASVKVLTPHQLGAIVFGTRGYEAILFDLKGCDIILDEIHTYSNIIQAIVLKIVEILNAEGCRIHIGTATMPSVLEKKILEILGKEKTQVASLSDDILSSFNRHIVHKSNSFKELLPVVTQAVKEKQKILIVCNRVANAQNVFSQIKDTYPHVPRMLIHSRFRRADRNSLEAELKEVYNQSEDACIVVSTQVVEVSLDISFDMMITETAPIDALIQRFGRINRKRKETTKQTYKPVYVIAPPEKRKDSLPYSVDILQSSFKVLPDGNLLEEKTLQDRIDEVYQDISFIDINLDAVFTNNQWRLRKLLHYPKSAFLEKLEIDSVTCICKKDQDNYYESNADARILFEIPVNYNSVRGKGLEQLKYGSNPFVVPNSAYSNERGLDISRVSSHNHDVNDQIL